MAWDILGQEWAAGLLAGQIARGQVSHAYLLTGPEGVGKTALALRFAQALNCQNPPEPGQPCRACRACRLIEQEKYPDLIVVEMKEDSTRVTADQVRLLLRRLSLAPNEAGMHVALLKDFHQAHPGAANALLKTLEEAPARTVLILTASSPEDLLPTIQSRCEVLRLRPLPVARLAAELERGQGLDAGQAARVAAASGGRVELARRMAAEPALLEQRREWVEMGLRLAGKPLRERFAAAARAGKDRDQLRAALEAWQSLWRDVYVAACGAQMPLVNAGQEAEIRRLAEELGPDGPRRVVAAIEDSLRQVDVNVSPRLLAEVLLLDWPRGEF